MDNYKTVNSKLHALAGLKKGEARKKIVQLFGDVGGLCDQLDTSSTEGMHILIMPYIVSGRVIGDLTISFLIKTAEKGRTHRTIVGRLSEDEKGAFSSRRRHL